MKPFLVSITGADDQVRLDDLKALAVEFPRLELAVLYHVEGQVRPRYPSSAWRTSFLSEVRTVSRAVHLCGIRAFQELLTDSLPAGILTADRLQLNVNARKADFTLGQTLEIYAKAEDWARAHGKAVILQLHPGSEAAILAFCRTLTGNRREFVQVLMDSSGGKGIETLDWQTPEALAGFRFGFAGGLGPANVGRALEQLSGRSNYWIDMESAVRSDNQFDLVKVRQVLEAA